MPRRALSTYSGNEERYSKGHHQVPFQYYFSKEQVLLALSGVKAPSANTIGYLAEVERTVKGTLYKRSRTTIENEVSGPYSLQEATRCQRLFDHFTHLLWQYETTKGNVECRLPDNHTVQFNPHLEAFGEAFSFLSKARKGDDPFRYRVGISQAIDRYVETLSTDTFRGRRKEHTYKHNKRRRQLLQLKDRVKDCNDPCLFLAFSGEEQDHIRTELLCMINGYVPAIIRNQSLPSHRPHYVLRPYHHPDFGNVWLVIVSSPHRSVIQDLEAVLVDRWVSRPFKDKVYTVPVKPLTLERAVEYIEFVTRSESLVHITHEQSSRIKLTHNF